MRISRRRFIVISASVAAVPATAIPAWPEPQRWSGYAMGAHASLSVHGVEGSRFQRISDVVTSEISRLEQIFSLYREDSDIVRLNSAGKLDAPSADLVRLLSLAGSIHQATDGAFDPTVQPLWRALAEAGENPDPGALMRARKLIGWPNVSFDPASVSFGIEGMALTLNGIAQGYATDRVADLLRAEGMENVLVSVGEIAALGVSERGDSWCIGISETEDGLPEEQISLTDAAIATSSPGVVPGGFTAGFGHIIDPRSGQPPAAGWRRVSVIHPSAAIADGLSTAFCSMDQTSITKALANYPDCRLVAIGANGVRFAVST